MRTKTLFVLIMLAFTMVVPTAMAKKDVLLDSVEAELLAHTNGWGRAVSEITTSKTAYGGILDKGDACMVTYPGYNDPALVTFEYEGSARYIEIRHLDGFADDGFDVHVLHANGKWVYVDTYEDNYDDEYWETSIFYLPRGIGEGHSITIKITLTDDDHSSWSAWTKWGHLAIDWIELHGNGKLS